MPDYASRINRVIDYMESHMDQDLTLEELAAQACFSVYHFHRIFSTFTGERPFRYLQRLRLERAANLLHSRRDLNVTRIAFLCGFGNIPAFSRAFKIQFGLSPTRWRSSSGQNSNLSKAGNGADRVDSPWIPHREYARGGQIWRMRREEEERIVEVRNLEPLILAYVRYIGPYKGDGQLFHRLWQTLCDRAGAGGLIGPDSRYLAIYHDNPELTEEEKLRVTLAVSTPADFLPTEELGRMELEGGKYALARFRLNSREYGQAWDWVYREWLPRSGYLPGDSPAFELFPRDGDRGEDGRYPVVIAVPLVTAP